MKLVVGVCWELEDQATARLVKDRRDRGVFRGSHQMVDEPYPWLTAEQLKDRQQREVYTTAGYPDPALVEGRFWRVHNPLFGVRSLPKPE